MIIDAIEDIQAFWKNLGSRTKLYKVIVGKKEYKNMELTYEQTENGERFVFKERKNAN